MYLLDINDAFSPFCRLDFHVQDIVFNFTIDYIQLLHSIRSLPLSLSLSFYFNPMLKVENSTAVNMSLHMELDTIISSLGENVKHL